MQQREGQLALEIIAVSVGVDAGLEGFLGQPKHDARVFAAGEQQRWPLERCCDLAQDEDRLFFEPVEMALVEFRQQRVDQFVDMGSGVHAVAPIIGSVSVFTCKPHSLVDSSHHQRPARKSSPTAIGRVQGAQPMLGMNWSCSGL